MCKQYCNLQGAQSKNGLFKGLAHLTLPLYSFLAIRTIWVQAEILLLWRALEIWAIRDSRLVLMQNCKCGYISSELSSNNFSFNNRGNRFNNNMERKQRSTLTVASFNLLKSMCRYAFIPLYAPGRVIPCISKTKSTT